MKGWAEREGVSINQLISTAVAEKMSALMTEEYLGTLAAQGNRQSYLKVLDKVPSNEPDPWDR
jgi:hypothetical protein